MNRIKQHSALWRALKAHYLGANDCASILGYGFQTVDEVISAKVSGILPSIQVGQQERMDRGTRFEPLVRQACSVRNGIQIRETGMKFHKRLKFLTASPDGLFRSIGGTSSLILTEFKVLSQLSDGKIPYKYWIQMQIQMAVWGINQCLYCENIVKDKDEGGGEIIEYYEHLVTEDPAWFASVTPIIVDTWNQIEELRRHRRSVPADARYLTADARYLTADARYLTADVRYLTVTPEMLVNYVRKDPILDWLNLYGPMDKRDVKSNSAFTTMSNRKNTEFVKRVQAHITSLHPDVPVIDIAGPPTPDICIPGNISVMSTTVAKTTEAMQAGYPVILNACLSRTLSSGCQLSGRADMLVKRSHLTQLFPMEDLDDDNDPYHIVMIKYATLNLKNDGRTLMNNDKQRVYKAQLCLLNQALGNGNNATAYLLGRNYTFNNIKITDAIRHISKVNFNFTDQSAFNKALDWVTHVRNASSNAHINIAETPSLFPNMKNHNDHPWHSYKTEIAKNISDITLMYRCGPPIREKAFKCGITQWQQLTGTEQTANFIAAQTSRGPPRIRINLPHNHRLRFYLDFESVNNMCEDFSSFPNLTCSGYIFFIGVLAEDTVTDSITYYSYKADRLDNQSEVTMLNNMFRDLRSLASSVGQRELPLYYWSNAEKYMLERAMGHPLPAELVLTDLCKMFRDNNIILPGQFGYGLKEITRLMKQYNMIETSWDEESDIASGMDAMIEAIRTYKYRTDPKVINTFFDQVEYYNYVDCKVMQEMVAAGTGTETADR